MIFITYTEGNQWLFWEVALFVSEHAPADELSPKIKNYISSILEPWSILPWLGKCSTSAVLQIWLACTICTLTFPLGY